MILFVTVCALYNLFAAFYPGMTDWARVFFVLTATMMGALGGVYRSLDLEIREFERRVKEAGRSC